MLDARLGCVASIAQPVGVRGALLARFAHIACASPLPLQKRLAKEAKELERLEKQAAKVGGEEAAAYLCQPPQALAGTVCQPGIERRAAWASKASYCQPRTHPTQALHVSSFPKRALQRACVVAFERLGAPSAAMQRGDSAAVLDAKKKELEARRAAASRAEKVYFRITVRVSGGVGR